MKLWARASLNWFRKFQNFLDSFSIDLFIFFIKFQIPRSKRLVKLLPYLLVAPLVLGWNVNPIFLHGGSLPGNEHRFNIFKSPSQKKVICKIGSKGGSEPGTGNYSCLLFDQFQGKPVGNNYSQQGSSNTQDSSKKCYFKGTKFQFYAFALLGWGIGVIIACGLVCLFFWRSLLFKRPQTSLLDKWSGLKK